MKRKRQLKGVYTDKQLYAKGGFLQDIGNGLWNTGATIANFQSSVVGGALGNPDLIPEIGYQGKYKREMKGGGSDFINEVAGTIGKVGAPIAGMALGIPPGVTSGIQNAVAPVTQSINTNKTMALGGNINKQYEAEGGEVVVGKNLPKVFSGGKLIPRTSNVAKLSGNKHSQGGMDMSGGDFIFSDKLKASDKRTFAENADEIAKQMSKYDKKLQSADPINKNTAKLMMDRAHKKLSNLATEQETMKQNKYNKKLMKYGGRLDKLTYAMGGGDDPFNPYAVDGPINSGVNGFNFQTSLPNMGDLSRNNGVNIPFARNYMQENSYIPTNIESIPSMNVGSLANPNAGLPKYQTNLDSIQSMQPGFIANNDLNSLGSGREGNFTIPNSKQFNMPNMQQMNPYINKALTYAPAAYNLGQGIFGKKDYYKKEVNPYMGQAMAELDASKEFNINQILANNASTYRGTQNTAKNASGGSGSRMMSYALAGQRNRNVADREAIMGKLNAQSEASGRAAAARFQFGESERAENKATQINRMQTDANKRNFLRQGLTDVSGITQNNQLMQNQAGRDEMLSNLLRSIAPTFSKYYYNGN